MQCRGVIQRFCHFLINPQNLLSTCAVSGFHACWPVGQHEGRELNPRCLFNLVAQDLCRLILSGDSDQPDPASQIGQIAGNIGRPARHLLAVCLAQNGNRGLWRNAFDTAINESVQHDITNHQNTAALHRRKRGVKKFDIHLHLLRANFAIAVMSIWPSCLP